MNFLDVHIDKPTLELTVIRSYSDLEQSLGDFYVNELYLCTICEKKRKLGLIPAGRYPVTMTACNPLFKENARWKKLTDGFIPKIENVPWYNNFYLTSYLEESPHREGVQIEYNPSNSPSTYSQKYSELYFLLKDAESFSKEIWLTIK